MRTTFLKSRRFWTYLWLCMYVIASLVLIAESLMPGNVSASQSQVVGNGLADIINGVGGDKTVIVEPSAVVINNKSEGSFYVGDTYQLSVSVLPEDTSYTSLSYSSSDESVASVSQEGLVTFLKSGRAVVTVSNLYNTELKDSISFNVLDIYPTSITSVITSGSSSAETEKDDRGNYVLYADSTYRIRTTIEPDNCSVPDLSYQVMSSSYEGFFDLEDGVIRALQSSSNAVFEVKISTVNDISSSVFFSIVQKVENIVELESIAIDGETSIEIGLNNSVRFDSLSSTRLVFSPSNATYKQYKLVSSDTKIARISGYNIVGAGVGITTVEIQSTYYPSLKTSIMVTVKDIELVSFDFVINNGNTLFAYNTYSTRISTFSPSNASTAKDSTRKYLKYQSSNEEVAVFQGSTGKLECLKEGTTTITLKMLKAATCEDIEENYISCSKVFYINGRKEVTDFNVAIDYGTRTNLYGTEGYLKVGEEYDLTRCIRFSNFLNESGENVATGNYNTGLKFYYEDNEITSLSFDSKIDTYFDIRIYPYSDEPNFYLSKREYIKTYIDLEGIRIGEEERLLDDETITIDQKRYLSLGRIELNVFQSQEIELINSHAETYSLSLLDDNSVIELAEPSTSDKFSFVANNTGTAYLKISPFDVYGTALDYGYVIQVVVSQVVPTRMNLIIRRGEEIITFDDGTIDGEVIYYLGGNYWNGIEGLVPLIVGEKLVFDISFDVDPSYQEIVIESESSLISINSPEIELLSPGLSEIVIRDNTSGLEIKVRMAVMNHIGLDESRSFVIAKTSDHNGQLSYSSEEDAYKLTRGFSYSFRLVFDSLTTFKEVKYTSSDTEIVHIGADGIITPVSQGEATITAVVDDGFSPSLNLKCKFIVENAKVTDSISNFFLYVRKGLGHFGAFLVLGICSSFFYYLFFDKSKKTFFLVIILNFAMGFGIAAFTEFCQSLVPNRGPSFDDVLLDFVGFCVSAVTLTIVFIIYKIIKHYKNKKRGISPLREILLDDLKVTKLTKKRRKKLG